MNAFTASTYITRISFLDDNEYSYEDYCKRLSKLLMHDAAMTYYMSTLMEMASFFVIF